MKDRHVNARWVANRLGTSHQTVCRLIEEGAIQAYRLRDRGPWHIPLSSVHKYEAKIATKYGLKGCGNSATDSPSQGTPGSTAAPKSTAI